MENLPVLRSGVSKHFSEWFLLDEDALRRLQTVLGQATLELSLTASSVFHVSREDARFYETTQVEDVVSDANVEGRRVESLFIELRAHEAQSPSRQEWITRISFESYGRSSVRLEINSEDRKWALLLADELEPEIKRTFKVKPASTGVLYAFLIPLALVVYKLHEQGFLPLQAKDGGEVSPLAALIVVTASLGFGLALLVALATAVVKPIGAIWSALFHGRCVFLWGDMIPEYNRILQLRKNVLWGGVVAFMMSFLASGLWMLI